SQFLQFEVHDHPGAHHLGKDLAVAPLTHAAARAVAHELGTFSLLARARDRRAVVDASWSADGRRPRLEQGSGLVGFVRHQCASMKPAISVSRSLATAISGADPTSSAAQMVVPRLLLVMPMMFRKTW